jgi:hypothetical protein
LDQGFGHSSLLYLEEFQLFRLHRIILFRRCEGLRSHTLSSWSMVSAKMLIHHSGFENTLSYQSHERETRKSPHQIEEKGFIICGISLSLSFSHILTHTLRHRHTYHIDTHTKHKYTQAALVIRRFIIFQFAFSHWKM